MWNSDGSNGGDDEEHVIVLSDGEDADSADDPNAAAAVVVSVDPGHINCGVVRYDARRDAFDQAALLDLVCRCKHQGGTTETTPWSLATTTSSSSSKKKRKQPKSKPPTIEELPEQFCRLMDHSALAQEMFAPCALLAVERQMVDNTRMMVVSASLRVRCRSVASRGVRILAPSSTKHFWNKAAQATQTAVCFRPKAGHSKHKTDAKRMAARIMTQSEQSLFRRAAERNAAHQVRCPAHRARKDANEAKRKKRNRAAAATSSSTPPNRKRRKGPSGSSSSSTRGKLTIKSDDLMDAALQAIFAAQKEKGQAPGDPDGAAYRRLWHTRNQHHLLLTAADRSVATTTTTKKRKRAKSVRKRKERKRSRKKKPTLGKKGM